MWTTRPGVLPNRLAGQLPPTGHDWVDNFFPETFMAQLIFFHPVTLAGAWHGGLPNTTMYTRNETFSGIILGAVDWWFEHDFKNPACLTDGGTPACPCDPDDITMWNTNWFANVTSLLSVRHLTHQLKRRSGYPNPRTSRADMPFDKRRPRSCAI